MKNLFDETTLGGVTLRNRAWRSATWLGLAGPRGEITEAIVRAYTELAKGGAAMLVTGLTSIAQDEVTIGGEAKFYDHLFIAGPSPPDGCRSCRRREDRHADGDGGRACRRTCDG